MLIEENKRWEHTRKRRIAKKKKKLIAELGPIQNVKEYDRYLKMAEDTMHLDEDSASDDEIAKASAIFDLVHDYEEIHYPILEHTIAPGAILNYLMEVHNLTPNDLPEIGDWRTVCDIVYGKRKMSRRIARILSKRFFVKAKVFQEQPLKQ